jgi:hypothetical protein
MFRAGTWMDPDLNKYDLHHITAKHQRMSPEEWAYAYREAWKRYYSWDHCETIFRRSGAAKSNFGHVLFGVAWFKGCMEVEDVHPVECGVVRRKVRRNRRSTMPIEPAWKFYPKYWSEVVAKTTHWAWIYMRLRLMYLKVKHDPNRRTYTDLALTPIKDDEVETHELYKTDEAHAYLEQQRRLEMARQGILPSASAGEQGRQPLIAAE